MQEEAGKKKKKARFLNKKHKRINSLEEEIKELEELKEGARVSIDIFHRHGHLQDEKEFKKRYKKYSIELEKKQKELEELKTPWLFRKLKKLKKHNQ